MMREPHLALTPGLLNDFTVADVGVYRLIHEIAVPPIADNGQEISGITIYASIANPPVATIGMYTDSFEILACPSDNANPLFDYVASAWLWGHGITDPAGPIQFAAGFQWPDSYQRVMTISGYKTRNWRIYARSGVLAGETGTGRLITRVEAFCNPKSDSRPKEGIHMWATVPPFVPGDDITPNGSIFPEPVQQRSLSPRLWTPQEFAVTCAPGGITMSHHIGGGPWRGAGAIVNTGALAFNSLEYEEGPPTTYQWANNCSIGGLAAATRIVLPFSYTDLWGYPSIVYNPIWARLIQLGAGVGNQAFLSRPRVWWP